MATLSVTIGGQEFQLAIAVQCDSHYLDIGGGGKEVAAH